MKRRKGVSRYVERRNGVEAEGRFNIVIKGKALERSNPINEEHEVLSNLQSVKIISN